MASNLTKSEIKEMIKNEIEKSLEQTVRKEIKTILGEKATENEIREIIVKTMIRLYKLLWVRSAMWSKELK